MERFGVGIVGPVADYPSLMDLLHPLKIGFANGPPAIEFLEDGSGRTLREELDEAQSQDAGLTWRVSTPGPLGYRVIIFSRVEEGAEHLDPAAYPFHAEHRNRRMRERLGKTKAEVEAEHAARKAEALSATGATRARGETESVPEIPPEQ